MKKAVNPNMPSTNSLLKVLTNAGIGSRRKITATIKSGAVRVNGEKVTDFRYPVDTVTDHIIVDGKSVHLRQKQMVYLMLNKPQGIVSTTSDERGRKTVMDIIPKKYQHLGLYPVGRLDKDSTGLMLLTNDGALTYRLTHPKFEREKEYLIQIQGRLSAEEKRGLQEGIKIEDGLTSPAAVREIKSSLPYNYSVTIHEGKKRQVRRMLESLGHPVLALKRIRIGHLTLGSLREGETRDLSPGEIDMSLC